MAKKLPVADVQVRMDQVQLENFKQGHVQHAQVLSRVVVQVSDGVTLSARVNVIVSVVPDGWAPEGSRALSLQANDSVETHEAGH